MDWVIDVEEEENDRVALGLVGKVWTMRHVNTNTLINYYDAEAVESKAWDGSR